MRVNSINYGLKIKHVVFLILFSLAYLTHFAQTKSSTPAKKTVTINGKQYYMHKVTHGQSLFGIAKMYNADINAIIRENPSASKGVIVGQELKIPTPGNTSDQTKTVSTPTVPAAKADTPTTTPVPQTNTVNTDANTSSSDVDLLSMVDEPTAKKEKEYVHATFKSTRDINFHTTEVLPRRSLDFRISHRFAPLIGGPYNAWGIDGPANLMLSLEYSWDGHWMVGIQRSFVDKMIDGFFKWKIVQQAKNGGSPVNITYFGGMYQTLQHDPYLGQPNKFYNLEMDRVSYVNQLMISRKWSDWISTQVGFAHVHYNLAGAANGLSQNDCMVATGILRLKFSKRQAIIFEYGYRLNTDYGAIDPATGKPMTYFDSMGAGWEIETGGHVFQVFVTNSAGILEPQYFMKSTEDYSTSGMRIGFNIMRVFSVGGKKGSW